MRIGSVTNGAPTFETQLQAESVGWNDGSDSFLLLPNVNDTTQTLVLFNLQHCES